MANATFHFPPDFKWGVATASHQVEGNNDNNQWWAWEQEEGRIKQNHKSGVACDWWANAETDFDRAADMGLNALRLSIEWSRVEPEPGVFDAQALDRYREMIKGLRQRGLEPLVTLHHFSNPLWLEQQGAWINDGCIAYFARYVERVANVLGDQVDLWCTINEPNVYTTLSYLQGLFPPGEQNFKAARTVLGNLLKGHAAAYRALHRLQPAAKVGLAHNLRIFDPANPQSLADRLVAAIQDVGFNRATLNAVWKGWWTLPFGFGPAWSLRRTLDWIGLNYYTRDRVAFDAGARSTFFGRSQRTPGAELLDGGYGELYPEGLYRSLTRLARMRLPIYITENGIPDSDDDQRPAALLLHLHQTWRALQMNLPIKGYYHWTLIDNFEWAEGWTLRFGLIELNPETGIRKPRRSANLYTAIVRGNAVTPALIDAYAPRLRDRLLPG
ncbi:MAG: glycoside hydrolase family 1 protein [Anaerolineae bacterium]|nr:glycoside hydrolase family 1 protein [Anaerolineae bacterium]